jgi:Gas vesicle synthesis protein GvpO
VRELTGKPAEAVTGLERTDDGWTVEVEVLELERIPGTTDVLATYQVTLDDDGELQGCRRVHRYLRGSPGDE